MTAADSIATVMNSFIDHMLRKFGVMFASDSDSDGNSSDSDSSSGSDNLSGSGSSFNDSSMVGNGHISDSSSNDGDTYHTSGGRRSRRAGDVPPPSDG
jgi:hypothetical protein